MKGLNINVESNDGNSTKKPRFDDLQNIKKQMLNNQRASPVNQISGMDFGALASQTEKKQATGIEAASPKVGSGAENNLDVIQEEG